MQSELRAGKDNGSGINRDAFNAIYMSNAWGFGSGTGSIAIFNKPYINFINNFLEIHPNIRTVLDIGCGDWQIGRRINLSQRNYIGCDVSSVILDKTRSKFSSDRRQFIELDAVTDPLPDADLVIVKDVFQHLSNESISKILSKLSKYPHVIIQSDILKNHSVNMDIQNGQLRPINITLPPLNAKGYSLALAYTEGFYKIWNIIRAVLFLPIIKKGVFVQNNK